MCLCVLVNSLLSSICNSLFACSDFFCIESSFSWNSVWSWALRSLFIFSIVFFICSKEENPVGGVSAGGAGNLSVGLHGGFSEGVVEDLYG